MFLDQIICRDGCDHTYVCPRQNPGFCIGRGGDLNLFLALRSSRSSLPSSCRWSSPEVSSRACRSLCAGTCWRGTTSTSVGSVRRRCVYLGVVIDLSCLVDVQACGVQPCKLIFSLFGNAVFHCSYMYIQA